MNRFALEIFDDEGKLCTFYTVRWEEHKNSETDKFFLKYEKNNIFQQPLQELAMFISKKIGNEKGALEEFFRFENDAQALPPSGKFVVENIQINYDNFPLRLYCLRISERLVVLFNGCEKTSRSAQAGKTSTAFYDANKFSRRIMKAIIDKEIYITNDKRKFKNSNGIDEIIL